MKRQLGWISVLAVAIFATVSTQAFALYDLQITEMWAGQDGDDITVDWFELTNYGDMAWIEANDGPLFYDDGNGNPTQSEVLQLIPQINPGQSVIYLIETEGDLTLIDDFKDAWEPVTGKTLTVGIADEAQSLGSGGDGVTIWLGDPQLTGILLDAEDYGDTAGFSGRSWDVDLGAFSTVGNDSGAVATTVLGGGIDLAPGTIDDFEPGIGSPGMVAPEPGSIALMLLGSLVVAMRYRLG